MTQYKACRFCEASGWLCDECYVEPQVGNLMAETALIGCVSINQLAEALSELGQVMEPLKFDPKRFAEIMSVNETATGRWMDGKEVHTKVVKLMKAHYMPTMTIKERLTRIGIKIGLNKRKS